MRIPFFFFGIIFRVLFINGYSAEVAQTTSTASPKVLTYNIADNNKFHLVLSGSAYAENTKKCLIRKEKEGQVVYDHVTSCTGSVVSGSDTQCVLACSEDNKKIEFNKLSPRTNYIYIYAGTDVDTVKAKEVGGDVFGLSIPLLVNPIVTISNEGDKLKLATKTCKSVACPIFHKNVKYVDGTVANECDTANTNNAVEFDVLIPHYEMKCINYPSFFYKMPNAYMKKTIDVYKPQYIVTHKTSEAEKKKYVLKFTNAFPSEICLFHIKDAADTTAGATNTYASVCGGGTEQKCFAPCNNVELTLAETKPIVKILIQTRHHAPGLTPTIDGFEERKFALAATVELTTLIPIATITPTGITFNPTSYNPDGDGISVKFGTCTLKHFPADKPRSTGTTARCIPSSGESDCGTVCATGSVVTGLAAGKAYIIEITPAVSLTGHNGYTEFLFFRAAASKTLTFPAVTPTPTDVTATVKAISGEMTTDAATAKNEHTCAYYVSVIGKDEFVEAECEDSTPCRGFCKDTKTLLNLNPKTAYDIKVVSNKDYGIKTYENVATPASTLALSHRFLDKGFKVVGVLTAAYPTADCQYSIKVKKGETFEDVYSCPAADPVVIPPSVDSVNPSPELTDAAKNIADAAADVANKIVAPSSKIETSKQSRFIESNNFSQIKVARASSAAEIAPAEPTSNTPTSSEGQGSSAQDTPATNQDTPATNQDTPATTQDTPAPSTFPACTKVPLCKNIIIAEGYEADKEYQISVTAIGRSDASTIDIPKNLPPTQPTDANKQITVIITREENTLKITSTLPEGKDENSKCQWVLRNHSDASKLIVKKCDSTSRPVCTPPTCTEFTIPDAPDSNDYHLTLIHVGDQTVSGVGIIKQGEKSNKSMASTSMIIGIAAPVVVILAGLGFYFGYWKNKD